jgi:hypothetical protein
MGRANFGTIPGRAWRKFFDRQHQMKTNGYFSYQRIAELSMSHPPTNWKRYRCVMPGWDNSARRPRGARIIHGSTPELYEAWVRSVVNTFVPFSPEENLAFVNAWNEWAEGNHLEPDLRWGHAYLEAHRRAAAGTRPSASRTSSGTGA